MKIRVGSYFFAIIALILFQNCGKSTESTIIQSGNSLFSGFDSTLVREQVNQKADDFLQLTVGEPDVIETLDPLFAHSDSELRVLNLVYDGLTGLDELGNVTPALARSWDVSADSLSYTFHLRTDVYFHNNSKFQSSLGRKFSAKDVEFAIKRAAGVQVPTHAAQIFENISGFKNYFIEQHTIKNPANRIITDISGLDAKNDSTIVISLNQKNADFTKNLAHPYSSIYAMESLPREGGPILEPIGTGAFYYAKNEPNKIIFASNKRYFNKKNVPDRLDVVSGLNETELFKQFAKGEIDAIINLGPKGIESSTDSAGNLTASYKAVYDLVKTSAYINYKLYYHPASNQPEAVNLIANYFPKNLGENTSIGSINFETTAENELAGLPVWNGIIAAYTHNPFELYVIGSLAEGLKDVNIQVGMNTSKALFNEVALSFYPQPGLIPVLTWTVPVRIISQKGLEGIHLSGEAWNIDYRDVFKPEKD